MCTGEVHSALYWTYVVLICSHREEHNRHSECDSHQNSQTHAEDQSIHWVHFAVCMKQLGLHITCRLKTNDVTK